MENPQAENNETCPTHRPKSQVSPGISFPSFGNQQRTPPHRTLASVELGLLTEDLFQTEKACSKPEMSSTSSQLVTKTRILLKLSV